MLPKVCVSMPTSSLAFLNTSSIYLKLLRVISYKIYNMRSAYELAPCLLKKPKLSNGDEGSFLVSSHDSQSL